MAERVNTENITEEDKDLIYTFLMERSNESRVIAILRSRNKNQDDIDKILVLYKKEKTIMEKYVNKFNNKIKKSDNHIFFNPSMIIEGAIEFAEEQKFTESQKNYFLRCLMATGPNNYDTLSESRSTVMNNFLGLPTEEPISRYPIEPSELQYIRQLRSTASEQRTKQLNAQLNSATYSDGSLLSMPIKFNKQNDSPHGFFPVYLSALFLPKMYAIEKRVFYTSFVSIILQKTSHMLDNPGVFEQYSVPMEPIEYEANAELQFDISTDPGVSQILLNDSPVKNLFERSFIQILLWDVVPKFRSGDIYPSKLLAENLYAVLDVKLGAFPSTFYDTYCTDQDDDTNKLRRFLSVFSLNPTIGQVTPVALLSATTNNLGFFNRMGITKMAMCTIRMGESQFGGAGQNPVTLDNALTQIDVFIEGKVLVQKSRTIVASSGIFIVNVVRKYYSINYAGYGSSIRYLQLPGATSSVTSINTRRLLFRTTMRLNRTRFELKSVMASNSYLGNHMSIGSCCLFMSTNNLGAVNYWMYNPILATIPLNRGLGAPLRFNDVISTIPARTINPRVPGFFNIAQGHGIVFIYSS